MENMHDLNDIEEMRKNWAEINSRLEVLERNTIAESRRICEGKIKTAKDTLAGTYRKFMILEFVMAIVMPFFTMFNKIIPCPSEGYRIVSAILFAAYFLSGAVMDAYLQNALNAIDLGTMSVRQVARRAYTLKRRHHIFMGVMLVSAFIVLGVFVYPFLDDYYLMGGAIIGGLLGGAIGLKEYFKMMSNYRDMISDYEE